MTDTDKPSNSRFIIQLNWVDILTLSGVIWSGMAMHFSLTAEFAYALSCLFIAMLTDAFDGIFARKYGLTRDFGRYLDGFVDVLNYLIAPAIFLYCWGFSGFLYNSVLLLFIMMGIVRLSVFNQSGNLLSENSDKLSYWGMPVFWSNFLLGFVYLLSFYVNKSWLFSGLAILLLIYSVLMVYNGRFFKFRNPTAILLLVVGGFLLFLSIGLHQNNLLSWTIQAGTSAIFLTLPIIIGGVLHMFVVTKQWFSFLAIPVYTPWFGANKTWRGFVIMPLLTLFGAWVTFFAASPIHDYLLFNLHTVSISALGAALGFAYILFELPNSWLKRRLGAQPGEIPTACPPCFFALDQLDSILGCALTYMLFFGLSVELTLLQIVLFPFVAIAIKQVLYWLKLKKSRL